MSSNAVPPELLLHIFRCVALADELRGHYSRSLPPCLHVSRSWNECARQVLYEVVNIWWTSKRGASLISAINGDPTLLLQCQELRVTFPRLKDWCNLRDEEDDARHSAWHAYQRSMSRAEPVTMENLYDGMGEFFVALPEGFVQAAGIVRALKRASEMGEDGWMDEGPEGEAPRREGARELFRLVRRLSALRHLELTGVDWIADDRGDDPNPMEELPLLNYVVNLSVSGGENTAIILPTLLARTPNISRLFIDLHDESPPLPPLADDTLEIASHLNLTLPTLTSIRSCQLGPYAIFIIALAHLTLRDINLTLNTGGDVVERNLAFLLPHALHLDSFVLSIATYDSAPSSFHDIDLDSLFRAFLFQSTIRHLVLPCPPSHILFASLPSSTVSLQTNWPVDSKTRSWIVDLLRQVLEAKRGWLTSLASFKVVGPSRSRDTEEMERELNGEELELVEEARNEGLEIIFGDRERMRVEVCPKRE